MIKVGSRVKAMFPCDGKSSIQFEEGEVIYIGARALVQFDSNICGHDGHGRGVRRKCWMVGIDKLKEIC